MSDDIEKQILDQIERLKQIRANQNRPYSELRSMAVKSLEAKGIVIVDTPLDDIDRAFIDPKERKLARELLEQYQSQYQMETTSDRNLLIQLVYLEVLNHRYQTLLNEANADQANRSISKNTMEGMLDNLDKILQLKDKLGLTRDRKTQSGQEALAELKKKYRLWLDSNNGSRTLVCPHCSRMVLLKIRMEHWDTQKHPYYRDRFLYNDHLFDLYRKGTLTKVDIAKVLQVSTDYVDEILKRCPPAAVETATVPVTDLKIEDDNAKTNI